MTFLGKDRLAALFNNLSLTGKYLFSHVVVVLLTVLVLSPSSYFIARRQLESRVGAFSSELLQKSTIIWDSKLKEMADYFIVRFDQTDIAANLHRTGDSDDAILRLRMNGALSDIITYRSEMRFIMIDSNDGMRYFAQNPDFTYGAGDIAANVPYSYVRRLHARPYFRMLDEDTVLFSKVIYDLQTTEYLGILSIGIDPDFFAIAFPNDQNATLGTLRIVDSYTDATVLIYPPDDYMAGMVEDFGTPVHGSAREVFESANTRFLVETVASKGGRWVFQSFTDTTDIANISLIAGVFIVIATAAALGAAILLSIYLSRSETARIHNITEYANQIAGGDLQGQSVDIHRDELGQLSRTLEDLAHRIYDLVEDTASQRSRIDAMRYSALQFEFSALQSKINPHFIYNSLEMVNARAKLQGEWEISEMVQIIGDLMRESISRTENLIPLREEMDYIGKYLKMQNLLNNNSLIIIYAIEESALDIPVPNFILQPIIENAITHGLEPRGQGGEISVRARLNDDTLELSISDNGVGMDGHTLEKALEAKVPVMNDGGSMGLNNVDRRVKIMYGPEYGLSIQSKSGEGTVVTVRLSATPVALQLQGGQYR